jgi:ketosteroid isomerase-like protein
MMQGMDTALDCALVGPWVGQGLAGDLQAALALGCDEALLLLSDLHLQKDGAKMQLARAFAECVLDLGLGQADKVRARL